MCHVQAEDGFAGPGTIAWSEDLPDPIEVSAGSVLVSGVFTREDGLPLDLSTALLIYINGNETDSSDFKRGYGNIDLETGVFYADITDVPIGTSELILSFVLVGGDSPTSLGSSTRRRELQNRSLGTPTLGSGRSRELEAAQGERGGQRGLRRVGSSSVFLTTMSNSDTCANGFTVTLSWDDGNSDLDLWIDEPNGQRVHSSSDIGVRLWYV